jgi:AAA15 family ATPase/GTPase
MSIINDIEIKNFKSIRHQKIEGCKRINVFVGPPNVGKSNILEGLGLFSIDFDSKSFSDFVRIGKKSTTLFFNGSIENSAQIILNKTFRTKASYIKGEVHISLEEDKLNKGFENLDKLLYKESDSNLQIEDKLIEIASFRVKENLHEIESYKGYPTLNIFENPKENDLQRGPTLSSVLKYEFKKNIHYDSKDATRLNHPFGENIFEIISTKDGLHKSITNILDSYGLNFLYDSELQEYKIMKIVGSKFFTVPYFMIADTLQRLIFHEAAILSNKNAVLLFEEPESHMYPPFISKFTSSIINDENKNQYFIATHSPFVLNDFMENAKDDLAIYLVDYKKQTGETIINKMSDEDMHEAYQFGYDFFLNIKQFLPQST